MASTLSCCNACGTVEVTQVPGTEGEAGLDGSDGISAYTTVTADFVVPAIGATVIAAVESSVWMVIGQILIVGVGYTGLGNGPAHFIITAIPDASSVTLEFLGSVGDISPGDTITLGATVSPSAA